MAPQLSEGWEARARLVIQAGTHAATPEEIAAVHAVLYPTREAVCLTCPGKLGVAWMAIQRYVRTLPDSFTSFPASPAMAKTARTHSFINPGQTYRPHNSPVVYSNDNLTDTQVAKILKANPAAASLFGLTEEEGAAYVAEKAGDLAALETASTTAGGSTTTLTISTSNPLADENSDEYKAEYAKLESLRREDLDALYASEIQDGDSKGFANKGEVIKGLLAYRAK